MGGSDKPDVYMRPPLQTCAPVPMQTINTRFKPAHNRFPNQTQSPSRSPPPHAPHQPNDIYFSPRHLEITITKKAQSTTTTPHDQTTQPTTKLNRTHIPPTTNTNPHPTTQPPPPPPLSHPTQPTTSPPLPTHTTPQPPTYHGWRLWHRFSATLGQPEPCTMTTRMTMGAFVDSSVGFYQDHNPP